jgi:hypothetical protein
MWKRQITPKKKKKNTKNLFGPVRSEPTRAQRVETICLNIIRSMSTGCGPWRWMGIGPSLDLSDSLVDPILTQRPTSTIHMLSGFIGKWIMLLFF